MITSIQHKSTRYRERIECNFQINDKSKAGFYALGDEMLCYSIFSNLINNALEASAKESTVQINCQTTEQGIEVKIWNKGSVVPREVWEDFFSKFVSRGKKDGTGLGTYIAKLFVEAQNGRISVESSEETGTKVQILLPAID